MHEDITVRKPLVVGIGELLWDIFPNAKVAGGAPANFAYHASHCGCEACVVSAVGRDELGEELLKILINKKLNCNVPSVDYTTGTVDVTLNEDGVPYYHITENVAWDYIPFSFSLQALARLATVVCFGSLAQRTAMSGATIRRFLSEVPSDCIKVFDLNLRDPFFSLEIIDESLRQCHILKVNGEELGVLKKMFDVAADTEVDVCRTLLKSYGLTMVVLTKGVDGSYVVSADVVSFKPTPLVCVVDTVGAGDAFTAAFVTNLIRTKSIEQAHAFAVKVSAYVCTQHGAMPPISPGLMDGFRYDCV